MNKKILIAFCSSLIANVSFVSYEVARQVYKPEVPAVREDFMQEHNGPVKNKMGMGKVFDSVFKAHGHKMVMAKKEMAKIISAKEFDAKAFQAAVKKASVERAKMDKIAEEKMTEMLGQMSFEKRKMFAKHFVRKEIMRNKPRPNSAKKPMKKRPQKTVLTKEMREKLSKMSKEERREFFIKERQKKMEAYKAKKNS